MRLNMKLQFRFKREEIEKILRENKITLRNFAFFRHKNKYCQKNVQRRAI